MTRRQPLTSSTANAAKLHEIHSKRISVSRGPRDEAMSRKLIMAIEVARTATPRMCTVCTSGTNQSAFWNALLMAVVDNHAQNSSVMERTLQFVRLPGKTTRGNSQFPVTSQFAGHAGPRRADPRRPTASRAGASGSMRGPQHARRRDHRHEQRSHVRTPNTMLMMRRLPILVCDKACPSGA